MEQPCRGLNTSTSQLIGRSSLMPRPSHLNTCTQTHRSIQLHKLTNKHLILNKLIPKIHFFANLHFYLVWLSKTTEHIASLVTWPQKASPMCFSEIDGWDSPTRFVRSSRVAKRRLSRDNFLCELSSRIDLTLSPQTLGRECVCVCLTSRHFIET